MALWCRDLPFVDVPTGSQPKTVTIVVPYFENPQFLRKQLDGWSTFPAFILEHLSFIVVDDGSPECPAEEAIKGQPLPPRFRLFRIGVDVRWNWPAARNIGAHHAANGWILLTDIDHVVPIATATALVYRQHDPSVVYAFSRREHTGAPATPHSASFLMTRKMFWEIGGYDERGSGFYGNDGPFRRRLSQVAKIQILRDELIRHEYQLDSSTTRYLRKQVEDAGLKLALSTGKRKALSFPYHEVEIREAVPA